MSEVESKQPSLQKALADIAEIFRVYASDQMASQRWASTQKAKAECVTRAEIWNDAATELDEFAELLK